MRAKTRVWRCWSRSRCKRPGGTSTGTWPAGPQGVVVWSDQACYILVGEGVTATTANGTPLPANTPVPFVVPSGTGAPWRVSAIQVSTGGTLYAKPINIR